MTFYQQVLDNLNATGNLRKIPADWSADNVVDLSGNDYLGISASRELTAEFFDSLPADFPSLSASASRLLAAKQHEFQQLEQLISDLYNAPALLFNSGYHANSGAIAALASSNTLIIADRLVHASIIDGMILSRAKFFRFRHNDVSHLSELLVANAAKFARILIVVESVYSMDGDLAPLQQIIDLKHEFKNVELYVDEAHAFGVLGPDGLGLTAHSPEVDFTLCTLGKAAASEGAFLVCRPSMSREYLVNTARSLIFSTALAPLNCAWSRFIIERIPGMSTRRNNLQSLCKTLAPALNINSPSHIQPWILGSAEAATAMSATLFSAGFKVLPIRTPTVPAGTERLRFSISATIATEDILRLTNIIEKLNANVIPAK